MILRPLIASLVLISAVSLHADIATEELTYTSGETRMKGYLARPADLTEPTPAVLVVHEWWGQNDYARKRAEMLAELGYVALAVDMYGEGKTTEHPADAGKFSGEVRKNIDQGEARFNAALDLLRERDDVDDAKIAAIGYCFGGGVVLHMARLGTDLRAVVSFHGSIDPIKPAEAGGIKARILVCNGADDPFVSQESLDAFDAEMKAAGADFKVKNYKGAVHSFTNPGATEVGEKFELPLAYNKKADTKSWKDMRKLLKQALR